MRSNAHIPLPLWGILQTCNVLELSRIWRYVFTGAHPAQTILYAPHWLSVVLLQLLKTVRALQTSLARLHGVEIQPVQIAYGARQLRLAGFKLPTLAPPCRLPVRLLLTPEQKRAELIKVVKKRIQEQIYALTHTVSRYQAHGS
jgi:hypothetical protein